MSNAPIAPTPDPFREGVMADARAVLVDILGSERGAKAAASVATAFVALAKQNPRMRDCSPESVVQCIAMCALTGLMPGGALPGVYVLPRERRVQQGGQWVSVYELNFQVGFRGLLTLAQRAGYQICAYPLYEGAPVALDDRDRLILPTARQRIDRSWEKLIGVVVTAHRMSDGMSMGRFFVEADIIEARRDASDSWKKGQETHHTSGFNKGKAKTAEEMERARSSPWYVWAEEMSLKTALIYVLRRGYVPVDDAAEHILGVDARADAPATILDTTATVIKEPAARPRGKAALGLPDNGGIPTPDYAAENARLSGRTTVEQGPPPGDDDSPV